MKVSATKKLLKSSSGDKDDKALMLTNNHVQTCQLDTQQICLQMGWHW